MKHLEEFKLNEDIGKSDPKNDIDIKRNVNVSIKKDDPVFWRTYQKLRSICASDILGKAWDENGIVDKEFINKLIELKHYLNNITYLDDIRKF